MGSLTHLPDELLENIVDRLEDESLIQLSLTCRRFHFLVLPIVFARANIKDSSTTCFYFHDPPAYILRAFRLALFVQKVDSLGISFGLHTYALLPYVRELYTLVSRLPAMKRFYIRLSHSLSPGALHPGWQTEVIRLLDLVVQKSCVLLSVTGGDGIAGGIASATASQSRPTINPAERMRRLLGHFRGAMKSVIPQKLARLGSRNHRYKLREFRALSSVLFHPPFLDWTISTLQTNSHTLTAVSFETIKTLASTWPDILTSITLPFLSKFKLTPGRVIIERRIVKFNDVLGFLTRHPSIVDLDLFAITRPRNRRQPQRLLPALENLRADPWLISWFLNRKQPFKFLTSLKMVSEVYPGPLYLHFDYNTFDYNTFDDALYLLPDRAPHVTTLHISFYQAGITEWLDKHISQENSPLAALKGVTTVDLFQSWSMWRSDVRALMPQFLARFPQLQHLTYAFPPPDVEKEKQTSFIQEIMLACPEMKTVTIELGSPIYLNTLRS